jgi:DNA-binding LacI/PurR family transcriptional regulator/DNA-binding transcriptional regulator YhcF (GntR family)
MMNIRPTTQTEETAFGRALVFINSGLADGIWHDTGYLPALSTLAAEAGVSRITMWKAVHKVQQQGRLIVVPRGKISLSTRGSEPKAVGSPPLWREAMARLIEDILNGIYGHTPGFPSLKELCARYSVSYQTMRKILLAAVGGGLLKRTGRGFSFPQTRSIRKDSTLVFVTTGFRSMGPRKFDYHVAEERMKELIGILENECATVGLAIAYVDLVQNHSPENRRVIRSCLADDTVIGYLVDWWVAGPFAWRDQTLDYIHALARHERPTVVIDHETEWPNHSRVKTSGSIHVFRDGSQVAGRKVAEMLLGLGHRRVAYIGLWHGHRWSRERLQGMRDIFGTAGIAGNIEAIVAEDASLAMAGKDFFSTALRHRNITAWVCSSDSIALKALDFLEENRVKVPGDISIISFDNTLQSFERKLTSVDLNMKFVGHRLMRILLGPASQLTSRGEKIVEIEPTLIERQTVGKESDTWKKARKMNGRFM